MSQQLNYGQQPTPGVLPNVSSQGVQGVQNVQVVQPRPYVQPSGPNYSTNVPIVTPTTVPIATSATIPPLTSTVKTPETSSQSISLKIDIDYDTIILFVITLLTLLVLDMIFIYMISGSMFQKMIPQIQNSPLVIKFAPAILVYVIMSFALFYFIVMPKRRDLSKLDNNDLISAFILGLAIFASFDLTNLAIFQNYSGFVAIFDILWGASLFVITTYGVSIVHTHLLND